MLKINRSMAPWTLASVAVIVTVLVAIGGLTVFRQATADELIAKLDQAIAAAIERAEAGDVDGARQAIPAWSKLNVEYMRVLFQEIREVSDSPVRPNCSIGGRGIRTHLGDVKRAVAAWQIESFGDDPRRIEDAKRGAVAQVRILGEIAARYARQCSMRHGDYAGAGHPWTTFLRQISPYPELQAGSYLRKIADGEAERLKQLDSSDGSDGN